MAKDPTASGQGWRRCRRPLGWNSARTPGTAPRSGWCIAALLPEFGLLRKCTMTRAIARDPIYRRRRFQSEPTSSACAGTLSIARAIEISLR